MMKPFYRRFLFVVGLVLASFLVGPRHSQPSNNHPIPVTIRPAAPFSIVVIPDTQFYSMSFPEIFMAQTSWIAEHVADKHIAFVSQEGDIVNIPDAEDQWQVADTAMSKLDSVVPYGIAPGNHDIAPGGSAPLYAKYFPMSRLQRSSTWGGSFLDYSREFSRNETPNEDQYDKNSYHLFSGGGEDYIAFNLEFCPVDAVIDWVDTILDLYPDRKAIITTHSFTDFEGHRSDNATCKAYGGGGDNAGEEMWQKLIVEQKHLNIELFLSGHDITNAHGAARRTDVVDGHQIHQILANYQQLENGGNGYLRIMTFKPAEHIIQVQTYSPYINEYMTDADNQFELKL